MELKLALLISGGGTTAEAIIKASQDGVLSGVQPVCVISSSNTAAGIDRAQNAGVPLKAIVVLEPKKFESPLAFGEAILKACQERSVNFIGQYGWHWLTPENVISEFEGRIVNQHPGPLDNGRPDFGGPGMFGLRVHAARLCFVRKVNRDFFTEATTHRVTPEFDKGAIVKRKVLAILAEDTPESLQKRLLPIEWQTQIEALQDFANDTGQEWYRLAPLVRPDEEKILADCKQEAMRLYPEG